MACCAATLTTCDSAYPVIDCTMVAARPASAM